jgi:hypothetical protein
VHLGIACPLGILGGGWSSNDGGIGHRLAP